MRNTTRTGLNGWVLTLLLALGGLATRADVYYEVGPGQTYATIQAAINATPWFNTGVGTPQPVFTESHIINVHAGTYNEVVETDQFSRLNNQLSRTSLTNRLIIQANPGDPVVVNLPNSNSYWNIRESHVTIQGLTFTGVANNPNGQYIRIGSGGYTTPDRQRGGLIINNCEFVGAQPLWGNTSASFNGEEPGVGFSFAVVRNYVRNIELHYENPGQSLLPTAYLGNLYEQWGSMGGASIFRPNMAAGYDSRYYINNTLVSDAGSLTGALRCNAADTSNVTFANNVVVYNGPTPSKYGLYFDVAASDGLWPVLANNIQDGTNLGWARTATASTFATLAAWQAYLALHGGAETGSYDGSPLFDNAPFSYRLAFNSPGIGAADTSYWLAAIADLGIGDLLGYYNPWTDPGLQFGVPGHIGAMIPEPGALALLGLGLLGLARRPRR
jgi:hypothetical protein